jgi:hypothetical protein
MCTTRINFQEFVNQRTIVDHRLAHFLRTSFTTLPPQRQRASGPVILNDHRMVNRQIGRTAIKVFKGVAARSHHLGDELIGFAHRAGWVVHKARLNATPFADKRVRLLLSQLVQVETADPLSPFSQDGVGTGGTNSLDGSLVLGSKAFAQVRALSAACVGPCHEHEQQDKNAYPDQHEGL